MLKALQGIEPWHILAPVAALLALAVFQVWRARHRRQRTVRRELHRMQREFEIRDRLESREQSDL